MSWPLERLLHVIACICSRVFLVFFCFFGLVRTKILHYNMDEAMETRGGEIRGAEGDDAGHTPSAPQSSVSIHEDLFSFIGILDWIHIGAEWC